MPKNYINIAWIQCLWIVYLYKKKIKIKNKKRYLNEKCLPSWSDLKDKPHTQI